MSKICTKCKTLKELSSYRTVKSKGKEYFVGRCKSCENIIAKERLASLSPEKKLKVYAKQKERMDNNKDKMREHRQSYKEKNPTYYQERAKDNKDKIKTYRTNRLNKELNKQKMYDARNKYHTESMVGNFMSRCNTRYKQCKKKYPTLINMKDIKPYHFREIMERQNYICPISGISLFLFCPVTEEVILNYNVDHIVPLSRGGTHELNNIQFLTPRANGNKSDNII